MKLANGMRGQDALPSAAARSAPFGVPRHRLRFAAVGFVAGPQGLLPPGAPRISSRVWVRLVDAVAMALRVLEKGQ